MEFEERVERFFKQFKTCLGVDPDLKAEFKSTSPLKDDTIEGAVYDATGEAIMEIIQSPRLPLDYTSEDKKHMDDPYVPLDYRYQSLIDEYEIDPKYKVHTECININKARIREDYTIDEAKLICRDYYEEHWGDGISYPIIIVDDIEKWLKQVSGEDTGIKELMPFTSKLLYKDIPPVEDILKELYDRIRSERDAIHQTLMECFKDKPVRNSSNNDFVNDKTDPLDEEYEKLEKEYLKLHVKNHSKIKKLLKKVLKQQKLDAMPTLEDVKEGRVRVSQETLMGIKAIEDELEKDLKEIGLDSAGRKPIINLRPKTKTGYPFSIDDPFYNYDFLFKKDDESNEPKLEKESNREDKVLPPKNFEEQVDLFFKQYHTCIGINPNFRASFKSKTETFTEEKSGKPATDSDGNVVYKHIVSDRIPFDYTPEELRAYSPEIRANEPWHRVMEQYEVDKEWERDVKIINIKRAMELEKYKVHDAIVIIESKKKKYWSSIKPVVFPDSIIYDIIAWCDKRKKAGLESSRQQEICDHLDPILKAHREINYDKLIRAVKGENITRTLRDNEKQVKAPDADKQNASPEKESTKEIRFKNNFDDTPEGEVYDHFYAGLIYEEERDIQKDYLSKSDLDKFLKAAFEDKKPPKKLFVFKNNKTKAVIYKPFHIYFDKVALKKKRTKEEKKETTDAALYASLLEDYFRNWTSVKTNFNKYGKDD
jgi:hypothetical protein